jgi:hypothetical protein
MNMTVQRILWTDTESPDSGRWTDVRDAPDQANAIWQAAISAGPGTRFLTVAELPEGT